LSIEVIRRQDERKELLERPVRGDEKEFGQIPKLEALLVISRKVVRDGQRGARYFRPGLIDDVGGDEEGERGSAAHLNRKSRSGPTRVISVLRRRRGCRREVLNPVSDHANRGRVHVRRVALWHLKSVPRLESAGELHDQETMIGIPGGDSERPARRA